MASYKDVIEFSEGITGGKGNNIDKLGSLICVGRIIWRSKPKQIGKSMYVYDPTFFDEECTQLYYNYIESDASLRKRIMAKHAGKG